MNRHLTYVLAHEVLPAISEATAVLLLLHEDRASGPIQNAIQEQLNGLHILCAIICSGAYNQTTDAPVERELYHLLRDLNAEVERADVVLTRRTPATARLMTPGIAALLRGGYAVNAKINQYLTETAPLLYNAAELVLILESQGRAPALIFPILNLAREVYAASRGMFTGYPMRAVRQELLDALSLKLRDVIRRTEAYLQLQGGADL